MLRDMQAVITSQSLDVVLSDTALLRDVDLQRLMTDDQRLCFYANLLNLMTLHAFAVFCALPIAQVSFIYFYHV